MGSADPSCISLFIPLHLLRLNASISCRDERAYDGFLKKVETGFTRVKKV
jgi:hypothetical protein